VAKTPVRQAVEARRNSGRWSIPKHSGVNVPEDTVAPIIRGNLEFWIPSPTAPIASIPWRDLHSLQVLWTQPCRTVQGICRVMLTSPQLSKPLSNKPSYCQGEITTAPRQHDPHMKACREQKIAVAMLWNPVVHSVNDFVTVRVPMPREKFDKLGKNRMVLVL
jgi:hypothetical protein